MEMEDVNSKSGCIAATNLAPPPKATIAEPQFKATPKFKAIPTQQPATVDFADDWERDGVLFKAPPKAVPHNVSVVILQALADIRSSIARLECRVIGLEHKVDALQVFLEMPVVDGMWCPDVI